MSAGLPGWRVTAGPPPEGLGFSARAEGTPGGSSTAPKGLGLSARAGGTPAGSSTAPRGPRHLRPGRRSSAGGSTAPGTSHTEAALPGGPLLLAVGTIGRAAETAARCFPAGLGTLAGWQQSTQAFAEACLRDGEAGTLAAAVLAPPFLGFVCAGGGFLVLERDPGGSMPLAPPERHGVLADCGLTAVALCAGGDGQTMLTARRQG